MNYIKCIKCGREEPAFDYAHICRSDIEGVQALREQLAASQAREAKLRDFIFDYIDIEPNNERMIQRYDECVKPTDDTALRQYVAKELRSMAVSLENTYGCWIDLRRKADELENVSKNLDKNSNM